LLSPYLVQSIAARAQQAGPYEVRNMMRHPHSLLHHFTNKLFSITEELKLNFNPLLHTQRAILGLVLAATMSLSAQATPLPGTPDWNTGFDGSKALQHVQFLASDICRGRYSGFAGADIADKYIADHFKSMGLERPFGGDGYFHRFAYGAGEYLMPSSLVIHSADGRSNTASMWRHMNILKYSGFGKVSGKVVFVGYGISAPELGWDDYAGMDVKDAIVFAWRGTPSLEGKDFGGWGYTGKKSSFALEKGAIGFIYCETDPPKLATITERYFRDKMPAVWVSKTFADTLLRGTGKAKDEWKKLADSTRTPVSRALDVTADLQISGKYYQRRKTDNVAGMLIGSDPILKNEVVVIGAHMDHHGVDAAGYLYPGADDNASGTAAVMELARIFTEKKIQTKRSVIFIGFAGEEEGLVGSKAFVKNPMLPKGMNVVAMLNMDMVGQGNCSLGVGGISEFPVLGEAMFANWPDSALKPLEFWGLYDGSDHASFRDDGIPSYVIGARGDHPNYHTPGDSAANIKPEVLKSVGDMMFHCAVSLADHPQPIKPMVGKGQWLVNKYGGTSQERFDVPNLGIPNPAMVRSIKASGIPLQQEMERIQKERAIAVDNSKILGVEYAEPLHIITLQHFAPSLRRLPQVSSGDLHRAVEFLREKAIANRITWLGDSTQKGWHGSPFVGVCPAIEYYDLPEDTLDLYALAKAGVGFLTADGVVADPPFEDGYYEDTDTYYAGWRGISVDSRRAGMRLWITRVVWVYDPVKMSSGQDYNEFWTGNAVGFMHGVRKLIPLWDGQIVCDVSVKTRDHKAVDGVLPVPELDSLLSTGCFVITNDIGFIKSHQDKSDYTRIGIPSDPQFVETLLDQGFKEDQIGELLFGNLQRTLQKWWADPSYR